MTIESDLKKLKKSELIELVCELYGRSKKVDEIIEDNLNQELISPQALFASIKRRIKKYQNDKKFIDYYDAPPYAAGLLNLIIDIDTDLREHNIVQALNATESFLGLHQSVFERADDSNGNLGDLFRSAVLQWLDIAAEVRRRELIDESWVTKVLSFFENNPYGVLDDVIRFSRRLLTEEELTQLAWRFENDAKKALNRNKNAEYNSAAAHACIGLRSVAEAKEDMALFEKSCLLISPSPNSVELEDLVVFALEINNLERAQYWLSKPRLQEDGLRYKALRNQLFQQMGATKELKQYLSEEFYQDPNAYTLEQYWALANKTERKAITKQLPLLLKTVADPEEAIEMALFLEQFTVLENLLLKHAEELKATYYGNILNWLKLIDENEQALIAAIFYRCLLCNILDRAYSKAYPHAVRYFKKLLKLDKKIAGYRGLIDAEAFIKQLQELHWRKRSFWEQADYPNKPEADTDE